MLAEASSVWWVITDPIPSMADLVIAPLNLGILLKSANVMTSKMEDFPEPVGPVIANIPAAANGSVTKEMEFSPLRLLMLLKEISIIFMQQ